MENTPTERKKKLRQQRNLRQSFELLRHFVPRPRCALPSVGEDNKRIWGYRSCRPFTQIRPDGRTSHIRQTLSEITRSPQEKTIYYDCIEGII